MTNRAIEWLTARSLDVEVADRLGWESGKRGAGEVLIIPTFRRGRAVSRKYRLFDKPDQRWATDGETCFWNEDVLRDESLDGSALIITEGQFDALAAIQSGFQRTVSVPNGAPALKADKTKQEVDEAERYAFVREIMPVLTKERFPEVIIAADGDGPGDQLLHDLTVQLGRYRCKFVTYPKAKDVTARGRERLKDLNEVLEDYGPKGVVETLNRAQWMKLNGVHLMSELPPLPPQTLYEIGFDALSENYKMRLGDLVVVTGVPGYGKTSFINDVCCRVAQNHGLRIAWASFEQAPQRDHKRSLRTWFGGQPVYRLSHDETAAADAWIDRHHVFICPEEDEDATFDWLLDAMEGAVVRHGAKVVVVDPWNEIEHSRRPGESETEYTGWAIRSLKRFARKFQVHLIIVAHPAKLQKDKGRYQMVTLYDISGSANWYNKCDLGLIVHRENDDDTIIKVQKSRYHDIIGRPGEVKVQFCMEDRRYRETERLA